MVFFIKGLLNRCGLQHPS